MYRDDCCLHLLSSDDILSRLYVIRLISVTGSTELEPKSWQLGLIRLIVDYLALAYSNWIASTVFAFRLVFEYDKILPWFLLSLQFWYFIVTSLWIWMALTENKLYTKKPLGQNLLFCSCDLTLVLKRRTESSSMW